MSKNTTKPAPKTSKTTATKGKKPAAKSTLTAAVSTPTSKIVAPKTVPIVKVQGDLIDTQAIANRLGRNWQFVNRQRHAGLMPDHVAVLKSGTYLYRVSTIRAWAKSNGYPFGTN